MLAVPGEQVKALVANLDQAGRAVVDASSVLAAEVAAPPTSTRSPQRNALRRARRERGAIVIANAVSTYRLGQQPPGDEAQHLDGGAVEPLGLVDQTHQWPLAGRLGKQAQHGQFDEEPTGDTATRQPETHLSACCWCGGSTGRPASKGSHNWCSAANGAASPSRASPA